MIPPYPDSPVVPPAALFARRGARLPEYEEVLRRTPGQQSARREYAPKVRSRGDEAYATALEWMAATGRAPELTNPNGVQNLGQAPVYTFFSASGIFWTDPVYLPRLVFDYLWTAVGPQPATTWYDLAVRPLIPLGGNNEWVGFRSVRLATEYLALALHRMRAAGDPIPVRPGSPSPE